MAYTPAESVVTSRLIPVAVFLADTVALTTTAPDGSVTVPVRVAPVTCARTVADPNKQSASTKHPSEASEGCFKSHLVFSDCSRVDTPQPFLMAGAYRNTLSKINLQIINDELRYA